ncbi:hypothetical protein [Arenicella xantha]|uniref:Uncharacterized protein n=1 Tax=Arenicella xantha TaxID=644221 RepID=A0A395JJS5_9GAMM|nr:hypothetical protein [Arenicella xantha]RBP48924.1 hypothetical protein DFR28_105263 [Arenicella xantha]
MLIRHPAIISRILLLLLFVWAQAAVAVHDVEHNWHESSELCQALQSAEHNKLIAAPCATINVAISISNSFMAPSVPSVTPILLAHPARSPPL